MEEYREESDEGLNVQLLERHKPDVSSACSKEAHDRVRTTSVLREPAFTNDCTETGKETGEEAGEPEAIDCNRGIRGSLENSRVGYVCQVWVTAVQQLMEEQDRLLLIIRTQIVESPDEEGRDDCGEQRGLRMVINSTE